MSKTQMNMTSGTNSSGATVEYTYSMAEPDERAPVVDLSDLPPGGQRIVIDLAPNITNRQIQDVFFLHLAEILNERGPDGTED